MQEVHGEISPVEDSDHVVWDFAWLLRTPRAILPFVVIPVISDDSPLQPIATTAASARNDMAT